MIVWIHHFIDTFRRNALLRKGLILLWYILGISLAYYASFYVRFDGHIPVRFLQTYRQTLPVMLLINLFVFALFRLYSGIWAYFDVDDVFRIGRALGVSFLLFFPTICVLLAPLDVNPNVSALPPFFRPFLRIPDFPRSVFVLSYIFLGLWMAGGRLAIRVVREQATRRHPANAHDFRRALVVGNLNDVNHLLLSLSPHADARQIVGIVTDETDRHALLLRGIPVTGPVSQVGRIARRQEADCILILPPYTRPRPMKEIVSHCEQEKVACTFRMIPSLAELADGHLKLSALRTVELEDLLGRPELTFDRQPVRDLIAGRTVLVTGAGGSIGSELARQIARYQPARLVLFEANEFNLYAIDRELRQLAPDLPIVPVAGSIADDRITAALFAHHPTDVVFHAAAYKHVPLMEVNVPVCLANNTVGTARLADQAERAGVKRFVMISSDKAVRPTSVMGASKRLAERTLQDRPAAGTAFVTVRFGNVLGSSGSVIPLFQEQIRAGGPVTVTSEKTVRFFMSIPEAVDLVLQAATIGNDRDILVLEMGEPIRIVDLARHLIELSGLRPDEDIDIVFTGLRPGEKEYEEVMTDGENVVRTPFDKIWVMRTTGDHPAPPVDIHRLETLIATSDEATLRREILRLIPEADPAIGHPLT